MLSSVGVVFVLSVSNVFSRTRSIRASWVAIFSLPPRSSTGSVQLWLLSEPLKRSTHVT